MFGQLQVSDKRYPDSLLQLTKNTPSDSIRARAFFRLSGYWSDIDTAKAKKYLIEGAKYESKYPYLKAVYYFNLAGYYYLRNTKKSEANYMKAEKEFSKFNSKEAFLFRAKSWSNYANLQQKKDNELLMIDILVNKSIPLAKQAANNDYLGKYHYDLGLIFFNKLQYDKAEKYFLFAISIFEQAKIRETTLLIKTYLSLGKTYLRINKLIKAKKILSKAQRLLRTDANPEHEAEYYLVEGCYYQNVKEYNNALKSINHGLKIAMQLMDPYPQEKLNFQKYKILMEKGDYKKAIHIIENILKKPAINFSVNMLSYYQDLSFLYDKLGNQKIAYDWLKKYTVLNDSLNKQDVLRKINQLEIKFKTVENQKKIAELNTANQKANLSAKNSRLLNWLLGTTILFILSILFFGIYYYRNQKKQAAQTEAIRLSQAMITGQETERYRIARELHDGLGNILAVVKFNLGGLVIENQTEELQDVTQQLDLSINELRRIAHDMMPEMLISIGLEAALKDLCESLTSHKLTVDYHFIKIENAIPQQTQLAIYRIVQELLTNVVKHAQATNVFLQCTQHKGIFFISLEDDGKGFDPHLQGGKTGIGLNNIKSRVAYLNGKIDITPRINGSGTSINIELNVKA
ncbi:hypothetical protein OC25_06840 [Pedobacter kyungheensis]|uniref:histidine kinase n=1 Tax=Pedobacter kyungheensis TaxID=1069985 RepID=A0A0C1FRJ5_9SPHI|nr:hypothetical protein OC25_06840 [Pedobacter kyungheensis]